MKLLHIVYCLAYRTVGLVQNIRHVYILGSKYEERVSKTAQIRTTLVQFLLTTGRILPAPKLNNDTFKFQIKLIVILLGNSVVIFQVVYLLQNTCLMINIYIWWKILFIKYKNGGGEKFNWFDSFAAGVIALTIQSKLYDFLKRRITTQLVSYNAFGPTTLIQQGYSASFKTSLYSTELSSLVQRSQLNSWTIR